MLLVLAHVVGCKKRTRYMFLVCDCLCVVWPESLRYYVSVVRGTQIFLHTACVGSNIGKTGQNKSFSLQRDEIPYIIFQICPKSPQRHNTRRDAMPIHNIYKNKLLLLPDYAAAVSPSILRREQRLCSHVIFLRREQDL